MPIYLDNSATTKVHDDVVQAMLPYLAESWGNPSSIHTIGRKSKSAVQTAREQVAALLNCDPEEVYFSPCGTLSNNVALLGRARFAEANGQGRHLITTPIEHPSIAGPAKYLESTGWKVTYLSVDSEGFVDPEELKRSINDETSIVSVMWANNEIGTVEPIEAIAEICAERKIFFHTDAVQAAGKVAIDVAKTPVSSLALSGHKFHAPKGIGILYLRKLNNVMPVIFGGGQEMGLMPGTEGLANIVAIGKAAEIANNQLTSTRERLSEMRDVIIDKLKTLQGVRFTGAQDLSRRLPGHISLVCPNVEGEALVMRADLKGLAVSSGSACHQGIIEPSAVLRAIGLPDKDAMGSMRITCGALNDLEECKKAAEILYTVFKNAAKMSQSIKV
ncbi:MAG TPA: cysteine desulfurase family protein [Planktothrix sp.]|jgi:cysteine desulfurase